MTDKTKTHPITIDLNQFKLHIDLKKKIELTLHFNSPSRRFYLSLIALVVNEMKRQGKMISISLEANHDLLALLNDTVGGSAGSSDKENLLPRIYRKWKDALPNLEEAPLFKVLGKKKEYDEGAGRTYSFTEDEKDRWANLFEYIGSEENVRLKFAIDKVGASLDDVDIVYEDSLNGDAWERFISNLKNTRKDKSLPEAVVPEAVGPETAVTETPALQPAQSAQVPFPLPQEPKTSRLFGYRRAIFAAMLIVIAAVTWRLYTPSGPQTEITPKEKIVAPQPEKAVTPAVPSPEVMSREEGGPKVASKDKMALSLPDRPSIAVLPFVNMSKDPEQEFFSDGMTEEIITTLSKSPNLLVVARTSTFAYKGKSIPVDQLAQELKVRYVLEGSVRRAGDKVRISAQLIDAKTELHLWAERYDGSIKDVFAIQDEIASKIMKTLQVKLRVGPSLGETRGGSKNAEAYLKSVEATQLFLSCTEQGRVQARRLFEEAIALEPDFSRGYSGLALCLGADANNRGRANVLHKELLAQAFDLAQKALSLNEKDAVNHATLAYLFALAKEHDKAVAQAERALALEANSFLALHYSGIAFMYSCRGKEALTVFEKTQRLNPSYPFMSMHLCWVYLLLGRYEEAYGQAQKAVEQNRGSVFGQWVCQLLLAATSNLTGREAEARAAAKKALDISPHSKVGGWRYNLAFKDNDQIDLAMNALRKAGLK